MDGTATWGSGTDLTPFPNRPRARKVLATPTAHVVVFSFAAGHELAEHATHHAAVVHCLRGRVRFTVATPEPAEQVLEPGDVVHLTPQLRHAVTALEDSLISVTMLVGAPTD